MTRHTAAIVRWLLDGLPALREVLRLGLAFDVILLSAVWMHVAPADRARAFRKMVSLLKPGGVLLMSLRFGPSGAGGSMHPVSQAEVAQLAVRLSDDGTGALPLLRHVILNDDQSSIWSGCANRRIKRRAGNPLGCITGSGHAAPIPQPPAPGVCPSLPPSSSR